MMKPFRKPWQEKNVLFSWSGPCLRAGTTIDTCIKGKLPTEQTTCSVILTRPSISFLAVFIYFIHKNIKVWIQSQKMLQSLLLKVVAQKSRWFLFCFVVLPELHIMPCMLGAHLHGWRLAQLYYSRGQWTSNRAQFHGNAYRNILYLRATLYACQLR